MEMSHYGITNVSIYMNKMDQNNANLLSVTSFI